MVHEVDREGHGKPAGRIGLAGQDIGDGIGALLAGRPGKEDGVYHVLPGVGLDDTADVENDDDFLASGMESGTDVAEKLALDVGEVEIVDHAAVGTLTGVTADDDDGEVIVACLVVHGSLGDGDLSGLGAAKTESASSGGRKGCKSPVVVKLCLIEVHQGLVHGETGILEAFLHVHDISLVDVSGAGAAGDEVKGGDTEQRDLLAGCDREGIVLVAEENHSLGCSLAGNLGVTGEVEYL